MYHFSSQKIVFNQKKKGEREIFAVRSFTYFGQKKKVLVYIPRLVVMEIQVPGFITVPQLRNNARAGEVSSRKS